MGKKTPKAPDPAQTIAAQTAANKEAIVESAKVNAVDQFGPGGSTTYTKDARGVPTAQTVTLTPSGQYTYNKQEQIAQSLTDKAAELQQRIPTGPMDLSGLPARQTSLDPLPTMGTVSAKADPGALGLTTGVSVPALQSAVASRSGELQRDVTSRAGELQRNVNSRTGEVSNLGMQDYGAATKATQDATFGKAQALLQPSQQLEQKRLEQSLSDRGIPLDSAAGRAELTRMAQSQSEANNRSAYDAVAAGSAEQSRLFGLDATRTQLNNSAAGQRFGQDLSAGQFRNSATESAFGQDLSSGQFRNSATGQAQQLDTSSAEFANNAAGQLFGMGQANAALNNSAQGQAFGQQQSATSFNNSAGQQDFQNRLTSANFTNDQRTSALQEAIGLRNQDFNEASALLQGAPVMGSPTFQNTPTYGMQPVDAAGIINTNYQQRLAASQANNPMSGLFGLGAAAITKFSDRRLKTVIHELGATVRGLPLYVFRYVWGGPPEIGVMAQDVAKSLPDAIVRTASGFLAVDYGRVYGGAA